MINKKAKNAFQSNPQYDKCVEKNANQLGLRIEKALNISRISKAELARLVGVKPQSVQYWLKKGVIKKENLMKVAKIVGKTPEWLLYGDKCHLFDRRKEVVKMRYIGPISKMAPLIDFTSVEKFFSVKATNSSFINIKRWIPIDDDLNENCFALIINDVSMISPRPKEISYAIGSLIVVDTLRTAKKNDFVIARLASGQTVFRKLVAKDESYYLEPMNPEFETIKRKDEKIYGVVVRVVQRIDGSAY